MCNKRRATALAMAILAFFIFVGSPFEATANALVVDASIISIIIAALAALGITITAAGSFGDITEYVGGLLDEYAQSRGLTLNQMFDGVQTGSNKLGDILLNNRFVILIDGFAKWIVNKFGLTDNDTKSLVAPSSSIGLLQIYRLPIVLDKRSGYDKGIMVISSDDVVYVAFGSNTNVNSLYANCLSDGEATLKFADVYSSGSWSTGYTRDLSYSSDYSKYYLRESYVLDAFDLSQIYVYSQEAVEAVLSNNVTSSGKQIDVSTGVINYPTDSEDYDDSGAILDVGGIWGESYDDLTDITIPVGYEGSTIEYQAEDDIAQQVDDTPAQSISDNVDDYQALGLPDVFPFCIPFDIYAFFECLAADPVAPSFTWRFYVPGICDEEIELDLSEFDSVAQIVRTMELLAFIVGLALVTRNRFLRG